MIRTGSSRRRSLASRWPRSGLGWIGESTVAGAGRSAVRGSAGLRCTARLSTPSRSSSRSPASRCCTSCSASRCRRWCRSSTPSGRRSFTVGPTEAFYRVFRPFIALFTWATNICAGGAAHRAVRRARGRRDRRRAGADGPDQPPGRRPRGHRARPAEQRLRLRGPGRLSGDDPAPRHRGCRRSTAPLDELLELGVSSPHSRFPVYEETLDNVVGIIHIKDLLRASLPDRDERSICARSCDRPLFVPETMPAGRLLAEFRRAHTTLAVVIDEYGGTAGVVTIDDVVEEIVGDVPDEFHSRRRASSRRPTAHHRGADAAPGRAGRALRRQGRRGRRGRYRGRAGGGAARAAGAGWRRGRPWTAYRIDGRGRRRRADHASCGCIPVPDRPRLSNEQCENGV